MNERENQYNIGLDKNAANYVPLTPIVTSSSAPGTCC